MLNTDALCSGLDALEDLYFMRHLILVLIHVPPEADVHLPLCEDRFRQDPPLMTTPCRLIQVLILLQDHEEVPNRGIWLLPEAT